MATFQNQATLSYAGRTTLSNTTTGELLEALTLDKSSQPSTYTQGETITYILSFTNTSQTALNTLTVDDDLGTYTYGTPLQTATPLTYVPDSVKLYINGVLQTPAPTVESTSPLRISGITLPAGAIAMLIYQATANDYAPLTPGSSITNTASISGPGITTPVSSSATVNVENGLDLSIVKILSPTTVSENGQITYTFQIINNGNTASTAADNIVVTDIFNPVLDPITVTYNGVTQQSPNFYTYTPTGNFATVPGAVNVDAATYTRDPNTGEFIVTPGVSTITVTGTI